MSEKEFSQQLVLWTDNVGNIRRWFFANRTKKDCIREILDTYERIKTMWLKHREIFPNKGTYKSVRRSFIKLAQRYFSFNYSRWEVIPADLCKEILHKADQGWISYPNEIPVDFCYYLRWKAVQAGYICQDYKRPCYVNDNLEVVYHLNQATGIVTLHHDTDKVEVILFAPLSFYKNITRDEALNACSSWNKCYYSDYEVYFPSVRACQLLNLYGKKKIQNCHLEAIPENKELYAPELPLVLIDDDDVEPAYGITIAENLYVSVYLSLEQFKKINPNVGFPQIYLVD
ncbi:MAG: hypothetical protein IJV97_00855 [Alphaproteobacteria bacterium]|nr:hypothetical protein [Alphaproteobacteria bacterium]